LLIDAGDAALDLDLLDGGHLIEWDLGDGPDEEALEVGDRADGGGIELDEDLDRLVDASLDRGRVLGDQGRPHLAGHQGGSEPDPGCLGGIDGDLDLRGRLDQVALQVEEVRLVGESGHDRVGRLGDIGHALTRDDDAQTVRGEPATGRHRDVEAVRLDGL
jgi:hypothetical protein